MLRFARRCVPVAAVICALSAASPAAAQEPSSHPQSRALDGAPPEVAAESLQIQAARERVLDTRRPGALIPLYVSFASLQVLDTHSTTRALAGGAVEANPAMRPFAGNAAGMLAIKAAGTAGVLYASEKMWKRNKTAAVMFMLAANSAMAWVVQNNYRAVR